MGSAPSTSACLIGQGTGAGKACSRLVVLASVLACGTASSTFVPTIEWGACEIGAEPNRECADVELRVQPSGNDDADSAHSIRVKRIRNDFATSDVWVLPGGPGLSGTLALDSLLGVLAESYDSVNFYTLDPRGTGLSEFLACPEQESLSSAGGVEVIASEIPSCSQTVLERYGRQLDSFGIDQAVHDLGALVASTSEESRSVFVWGQSAGTLVAQRFLGVYGHLVDGIILESGMPPDFSVKLQDEAAELVLQRILESCREDASCAGRLPEPSKVADVWRRISEGDCAVFGSGDPIVRALQESLFSLIGSSMAGLAPAFLARLERCGEADAAFVGDVLQLMVASTSTSRAFSQVLFQLVTASELWVHPSFDSEDDYRSHLVALNETALIGTGTGGIAFSEKMEAWPTYEALMDDEWTNTDVPMLILNGVLDARVPIEEGRRLRDWFASKGQVYVEFPFGGHMLVGATPGRDGFDCAGRLVFDFIKEVGLSDCANSTAPLDFDGLLLAPSALGRRNYWTDEGLTPGAPLGAEPEARDGAPTL